MDTGTPELNRSDMIGWMGVETSRASLANARRTYEEMQQRGQRRDYKGEQRRSPEGMQAVCGQFREGYLNKNCKTQIAMIEMLLTSGLSPRKVADQVVTMPFIPFNTIVFHTTQQHKSGRACRVIGYYTDNQNAIKYYLQPLEETCEQELIENVVPKELYIATNVFMETAWK